MPDTPSFADFLNQRHQASPSLGSQQDKSAQPKELTPPPTGTQPQQNVPSFGKFLNARQEQKHFDEIKPWRKMSAWEKTKFLGTHPGLDFEAVNGVLNAIHETVAGVSGKMVPSGEEVVARAIEKQSNIIKDPKSTPEQKQKALDQIHQINSSWLVRQFVREQNLNKVMGPASVTSLADWEVMGTLFKPLEAVGALSKGSKALRGAMYVVNQALGAKFSYDQLESGLDHWSRHEYGQAMTDFGGSLSLLVMPMLHVLSTNPGISQEEAKNKSIQELETLKKAQAQSENPPFSADQIERAQDALRGNNPFDIMTQSGGAAGERTALRTREGILNEKVRRENAETARQHNLAMQEADYQEARHNLRIKAEQAKTKAEHDQFMRDLDDREKAHNQRIEAEKERLGMRAATPAKAPLEEPPAPEKRPYEEPARVIRGRQPLTSSEREVERLQEREDQIRQDIAQARQQRDLIARRALDLTRKAEEADLREGRGFRVLDRRGLEEPPEPSETPSRGLEQPPEAAQAPPGPSVVDLERHETAATWAILEGEKRLADSKGHPAEEVEALQKKLEDDRKLLADVKADREAAEAAMSERRKPKVREAGGQIEGLAGNQSTLKTVTKDHPIRYRVVEASKIKPSNDPQTFEATAGYPEGVQERNYSTDRDAQFAVIEHAQNYDPSFTVNDSPGPEHGPPIITPDGIVLGGNSRAMSTMRMGDEDYKKYLDALTSKAGQFGLDPEQISKMKRPILVREIANAPTSIDDLRALGSDLNRVFTRKLSEYEQAVSAGKRISQETLDYVGAQLAEMGEGASLRDLLRDRPQQILEKLERDGVVSPTEKRGFVDEQTGALNENGKDFVERALLGAVVDDPVVLANAPKSILRKTERALAPLASIKARGEPWDITDYLKEALREHITAASKGASIEDHLNPPTMSMFPREPVHPIVEALAKKLESSSAAVRSAFEKYAEDANLDVKGQGGLGFFEIPQPWDSFNQNFGAKVRPDEWGTLRPHEKEAEVSPPEELREVPTETREIEPPPVTPRERLRAGLEASFKNVAPDQIDAAMDLVDARAKAAGKSTDEWIDQRIARIEDLGEGVTRGGKRIGAQVEFMEDGKAIIRAFSSNKSTIAALTHELGHIFRRDLSPAELTEAERAYGVENGEWTESKEERFAKDFEKYLADGQAPTGGLKGTFAKLKEWFQEIYKALGNRPSTSIRRVFDRMLGGDVGQPEQAATPPEIKTPSFERFTATKGLSDEDLRAAKEGLEEKLKTPGLSREGRQRLISQMQPFEKELAERGVKAPNAKIDKSVIFTKDRADEAKSRLMKRKPPITLNYTEDEDQTISDASTYMGHLFENGYRDFDSNANKVVKDIGEWVRPYLRTAFDKMLSDGRNEAQRRLQRIIPDTERRQLSTQLGLFETEQERNRRIEIPPGVEVRREATPRREAGTEYGRKEPNAGLEAPERERIGQAPRPAAEPVRSEPLGTTGRRVRPSREAPRNAGVTEEPARNLRHVTPPQLDVPIIPSEGPVVEPSEWKSRLAAANLPTDIPAPTVSLSPAVDRKLIFKGQPEIVQSALTSLQKYDSFILASTTGTGKCLAKGTPILMFDGTIKKVEEILVGDILMGPDSKPRAVLSLAHGEDQMYRVTPKRGEPYEVNEAHILSVKMTNSVYSSKNWNKKIINLSVLDYLGRSKTWRHCAKGYRVGVDFPMRSTSLPPYFLGLWLGDGNSNIPAITTIEPEVIVYLYHLASEYELHVRVDRFGGRCPTYALTSGIMGGDDRNTNPVQYCLKSLGLIRNKHVPEVFKINNRGTRLQVLAGLIDSDGSLSDGGYDLTLKSKKLAEDVVFLARSLGFAAYSKPCQKKCHNNGKVGTYNRIFISGDVSQIPVQVPRKKALPRKQKKDVLVTGITVKPIGRGEYFGFELCGDGLFLLGDFTVTHNTYTGSAIIAEMRPQFGLILTPSGNLSDNWIKTAEEFGVEVKKLPKDGIPKEPGVYVGTYATASSKPGADTFNWNLLLADESHQARRWWDSKRGAYLKQVGNASDKVVYISATPFHSALELGYMDKLGLWKKQGFESWVGREFNTRLSPDTGKWISPFNPRKLAALRQELINRGMMVNLDRDMRGYGVNFSVSPLSQVNKDDIRKTAQGFKLAEQYFSQRGAAGGNMVMAVRGNAVTFMKSYLERARLPEAIELGKRLEDQGWKVAYFTENKTEVPEIYDFLKPADEFYGGEISRLLPKLPGVVETLKGAFGDNIANFTGPHGMGRQEELDAFNRGDKKHIVATYAAGGLGISMHDTTGDAPRAAIYLGPPWSGVMFDQAIGRPWRFGTKSNVNAYILTSNAGPEMNLLFRKVLPRFESLKASISGVHKDDPIVSSMKDLDSYLGYEFGDKEKSSATDFMQTINTNAIGTIKEARITPAEEAKNKGMQVERRLPLEAPETLHYKEDVPPDLSTSARQAAQAAADAAKAVRRPFVPSGTEKDVNDPRSLDFLNRENRESVGMPPEASEPPQPPDEIVGTQQIPPPGSADVREYDLADPKISRRYYEATKDRFGKFKMTDAEIHEVAKLERGLRAAMAKLHTAPYVLKQYRLTEELPRNLQNVEMKYRRRVADTRYELAKILGDIPKSETSDRKVYEALARAINPATELKGASSEWVDNQPFTDAELRAAQEIRDKITEPIIRSVHEVRPDVGYRYRYAPLVRAIDELTPTLYPELNGKIPADLYQGFSLEVKQSLTKDPFSPHTLKRKGTPPKALKASEILDAYIPSMVRVAELTPEARRTAIFLNRLPESALKDYAKRYARIFFGVPSEYARLEKLTHEAARTIANLSYSAALDLNPGWFVLHSTKVPFNVWPELGEGSSKYVFKGYKAMTTPEGRELVARSGVLQDTLWRLNQPKTRFGKTFSTALHSGMIYSDLIDRGVAYIGGLEKAKDMGMFGDPDKVGDITWERLNQLAAEGVDIEKGLDFAYGVVARSNFMYTNANVQQFIREHPIAGMFKSYAMRQAEFFSNMRTLAKEAKAQSMEPEDYAALKAARGQYEYIDAVAKYRRLLMSTTIAAIGALGFTAAGINQRIWPYHLASLLSPPIVFGYDTVNLINKTIEGNATEKMWSAWLRESIRTFVPGAGWLTREWNESEKKKKSLDELPVDKYELESLPKD